MISLKELARLLSKESWDDFVLRMNEERAQAALEALVNDEEALNRMAEESDFEADLMEIAYEEK